MAPTIAKALIEGERILREAGIAENRRDASALLCDVLKIDHARQIARDREEISAEDYERYLAVVRRRSKGEPLQYIVGHQEFYGLDFVVTPDALIPRPETELLAEKVISLANITITRSPVIADIGTGSGCIAVSVAVHAPHTCVIATDISGEALEVARSNAERHSVASRIVFLEGDLLAPLEALELKGKIDIIASNPPYVPEATLETLQREVRDYEPRAALSGGTDGLDYYRRLLLESGDYLTHSGFLLLEIGYGQLDEVTHLGGDARWDRCDVTSDLQAIPRTLVFQKRHTGQ